MTPPPRVTVNEFWYNTVLGGDKAGHRSTGILLSVAV